MGVTRYTTIHDLCLSIHLSIYPSVCPSIYGFIYPSIHPSAIYRSIHLSIYLSIYLSISIYLVDALALRRVTCRAQRVHGRSHRCHPLIVRVERGVS